MAIVKMKKLRLMAVRSVRDELLKELLRHGCVEVSEPKELQDEAYAPLLQRDVENKKAALRARAEARLDQAASLVVERIVKN